MAWDVEITHKCADRSDLMSMKFSELSEAMSTERRERIVQRTSQLLTELPLQDLRKAGDLSQEELADGRTGKAPKSAAGSALSQKHGGKGKK